MKSKEIKLRAKLKFGDKFIYNLPEEVFLNQEVTIKCTFHGQFKMKLKSHLESKHGCRNCAKEAKITSLNLGYEEFIKKALDIHGDLYEYKKVSYKNNKENVKIFCKKHKKYFSQTPKKHLSGIGCPLCSIKERSSKRRLSSEEFIHACKQVHPIDAYDYSALNFKGIKYPIQVKCNKCNGKFAPYAYLHRRGQGCPKCASSKGESAIMSFLDRNQISYEREKTFSDLYDKALLRYDFFIPDKNMLIEFDGIQHFKPIMFNGMNQEEAQIKHNDVLKKDKIKNQYAEENGYILKRIGYKQLKNLESLLKRLLI